MPGDAHVSLSADLVRYLRVQRALTLRQIGELVDLSESFISRVAAGERSFTIEHLNRFEQVLGAPLPVLLLEAVWQQQVTPDKRAMFDEGLRLIREAAALAGGLAAGDNDDERVSQSA